MIVQMSVCFFFENCSIRKNNTTAKESENQLFVRVEYSSPHRIKCIPTENALNDN